MKTKIYARKCSVTGQGMFDGWCWGDGTFYTSTLEITLEECRKERENILLDVDEDTEIEDYDKREKFLEALDRANNNVESDDDLLLIAYQTGYLYYTEWYEESDIMYEEIDGELIEI
jgi:hypothetical protein